MSEKKETSKGPGEAESEKRADDSLTAEELDGVTGGVTAIALAESGGSTGSPARKNGSILQYDAEIKSK